MQEHELRLVELEKLLLMRPYQFDAEPVSGLTLDDLAPELVEQYLKNTRRSSPRLSNSADIEILRRTGVILNNGEPTLAGIYALGSYPQGLFPSLGVTAAVQLPNEAKQGRNRDLHHFNGPIPDLLDSLMEWSARNLEGVQVYREDGHSEIRSELPLRALREVYANALVHRDLSPNTLGLGKAIQVRLTPNMLLVQSPGGLRGVSVAQLEGAAHVQAAVNQHLYSISRQLVTPDGAAMIEGEGGGLREVFLAAAEYQLQPPTLINTGVQFEVKLWRPQTLTLAARSDTSATPQPRPSSASSAASPPTSSRSSEAPAMSHTTNAPASRTKNEPVIFAALRERGPLSIDELVAQTGLSVGQIRYALAPALREARILRAGGQGHQGTTYSLAEQASDGG